MKLEEIQRDIVKYVFVFDIEYQIKGFNGYVSTKKYTCLLNTDGFEIGTVPFDVDRKESLEAIGDSSLGFSINNYNNLAEVWFARDTLPAPEEIALIKENFYKVAELCEKEDILDKWHLYRHISHTRISNLRLVEAHSKVEILSEVKLEN